MFCTAKNLTSSTHLFRRQLYCFYPRYQHRITHMERVAVRRSQRLLEQKLVTRATMAGAGQARFYASNRTEGCGVLVKQDKKLEEFYVDLQGERAYLKYKQIDQLVKIIHTEVPSKLEGRGLGRILAQEALEYVAKNEFKLEIECDFVLHFVTKYEPKYKRYMKQ